jgi:soluble lytic murein transglycosylase-like protein
MNLSSLPLKFSTSASSELAMGVAVNTRPAELPQPDALVSTASEAAATTLELVTSRVKEEFLAPIIDPDHVITEHIKEDFFRSEVPFGTIIYREATRNGLPPELVAAIVETESDFRPTLMSHKNAQGLMQLIPSTGQLMGAHDLLNPSENVRAGVKYIRYLQRQFKDPQLMLAAYNAGETVVRRYNGIPPYAETQNYVKKVERRRQRYQDRLAERLAIAQTLRTATAITQ